MDALQKRRAEEKEQRREAIIDAAEQVFADTGFDRATIDEVARQARVSRALVYLYFKNRDELQLAVGVRALRLLREHFLAAVAAEDSGYDKVAACGHTYLRFAAEHPTYFAALSHFESRPAAEALTPTESEMFAAGRAVHEVMIAALETGIADGSLRSDIDDLWLTSLSLWAFTHGLIQLGRTKARFMSELDVATDTFFDYAIDMAMRGLQPPKPAPGA